MQIDVLIFGGGGAGLWLLDELHGLGHRVLLVEAAELGAGQTVAAQGIIHGGIKYTLTGLLTESARAIREMPELWRRCLNGERQPDLGDTTVLAGSCFLWRTDSFSSRLGMVGARQGLRSKTGSVPPAERPDILAQCPGDVFRVDEQVIDTVGFLGSLARRHRGRILKVRPHDGACFHTGVDGRVESVELFDCDDARLSINPGHVVLTAGAGNAELRRAVGLSAEIMQRRPLHMVLVRGRLPALFGHCVDGAKTRVTITSHADAAGRTVWQVGGQLAEDGVALTEGDLIERARGELQAVLPGWDPSGLEWATYRIDRAEAKTPGGIRPAGPQLDVHGNVVTVWPTKLALVPRAAKLVAEQLGPPRASEPGQPLDVGDWPAPDVAKPPWEVTNTWHR
ncbi:MAG: FAD-dependent oxidoreductase [Phycisphaerae bacterium]